MSSYDPLDPTTDPFRPPDVPTMVGCIHCGEEFDSYQIEWRVEKDEQGKPHGFWCCPIPGCDGRGFGFDILPLDRNYKDENFEWIHDEGSEEELDDSEDSEDDEPRTDDDDGGLIF